MSGDIGEGQFFRANELDWRPFEHGIMLFTNESRVFDGFMNNVMNILHNQRDKTPGYIQEKIATQLSCR
jgi:hypothetical protein